MELNERIAAVRKNAGLTMEKFGEHIGIGKSAVSLWEAGHNVPAGIALKAISHEFNVREEWLRTGEGEMYYGLREHDLILQRIEKIQRAKETNVPYAAFKESLASAILNLDDNGCKVIQGILTDMGYEIKPFE